VAAVAVKVLFVPCGMPVRPVGLTVNEPPVPDWPDWLVPSVLTCVVMVWVFRVKCAVMVRLDVIETA